MEINLKQLFRWHPNVANRKGFFYSQLVVNAPQMNYGEKLYEGKAKIVFKGPKGTLFHYFKDSATAFNAQKKAEFEGKGAINLKMSSMLFEYLQRRGIPTHYLGKVDDRTFETHSLKMLPVEVVVRNRMAGSLAKRLQEAEGAELNPPLVEWYLKDDKKGDPQVSEDLLVSFYGVKREDLKSCQKLALEVNKILSPLFDEIGLILADFKLEFGKTPSGEVVMADEFSPDTSRLWDKATREKMDKDRFRFDLGDLMKGYREVLNRLEKRLQS